ncbi:MAG: YceI family protein [Limisphaerales bacterium]
MKTRLILTTIALTSALGLQAADGDRYQSQPAGNKVRIEGTSTAHDWEMEGTLIGGFVEFGPGVQLDTAQATIPGLKDKKLAIKSQVIIPVRSIKSNAKAMPQVMEGLTQEAMKEPQNKRIECRISELTFKEPHAAGKPFEFDASGELAIAGVTNKVTFPVTIDVPEKDKLKITGSAPVKMTAYGIKPPAPSFGLGLMKCGDDVKVIFDWNLAKTAATASK